MLLGLSPLPLLPLTGRLTSPLLFLPPLLPLCRFNHFWIM
jgi:hypothetical protein